MGATKTDLFTEEQNALAMAAKAFAHPARVAIIQYKKREVLTGPPFLRDSNNLKTHTN